MSRRGRHGSTYCCAVVFSTGINEALTKQSIARYATVCYGTSPMPRSNAHAQPARVTRKRITRPAFEAKGEKRRRIPKALASPRLPIILFASPLPLSNSSTDFSIEMYPFNSFTRITTTLKVKYRLGYRSIVVKRVSCHERACAASARYA